uniref:RAP domain-containing protein n=1 Tax=Denticeps clupeoides TaxID=299321 RepID=A0AAY4ASR6_9TELE
MNVCKSGEELLRRVLLYRRHSPLCKQLGSLLQKEQTQQKVGIPRTCYLLNVVCYTSQGHTRGKSFPLPTPVDVEKLHADQLDLGTVDRRLTFYSQLQESMSPSDVLDLLKHYSPTHRHVSNSLTRIWELTKKLSDDQRRYELRLMFEHPGFEELCQVAMVNAHRMRCEDLAYSLLAMVKLGMPQRSRVVQTLLRVTQENLNQFNERALSVLAMCLSEMEAMKNVDTLKKGLRLVLENNVNQIRNVVPLQSIMRLVGKDVSPGFKKKLEQKALSMAEDFSLPNAQYMLSTLAAMELNSRPLLDICSKNIAENVHGVPFNRLLAVLRSCGELHYRNTELLLAISEHVATTCDMWTNKQVILLLLEFENLGFLASSLLDAFTHIVIQKADTLTLRDVLSILKVYSSLNHIFKSNRDQFLSSVTSVVESYLTKMLPNDMLKAAFCLCILGHFPPALLERLLQKETVEELCTIDHRFLKGMEQKLHIIDLCLRLDHLPLPQPLCLPPGYTSTLSQDKAPVSQDLLSTLKSVVAEEDVVQESVIEENGYFIVMHTGVDVQTLVTDTFAFFRIALLCPPLSSLSFGTTHPNGKLAMKVRHLSILGYSPVLISLQHFLCQTEEERTSILRKLIFPEHKSSGIQSKCAFE